MPGPLQGFCSCSTVHHQPRAMEIPGQTCRGQITFKDQTNLGGAKRVMWLIHQLFRSERLWFV